MNEETKKLAESYSKLMQTNVQKWIEIDTGDISLISAMTFVIGIKTNITDPQSFLKETLEKKEITENYSKSISELFKLLETNQTSIVFSDKELVKNSYKFILASVLINTNNIANKLTSLVYDESKQDYREITENDIVELKKDISDVMNNVEKPYKKYKVLFESTLSKAIYTFLVIYVLEENLEHVFSSQDIKNLSEFELDKASFVLNLSQLNSRLIQEFLS